MSRVPFIRGIFYHLYALSARTFSSTQKDIFGTFSERESNVLSYFDIMLRNKLWYNESDALISFPFQSLTLSNSLAFKDLSQIENSTILSRRDVRK